MYNTHVFGRFENGSQNFASFINTSDEYIELYNKSMRMNFLFRMLSVKFLPRRTKLYFLNQLMSCVALFSRTILK